MKRNERSAVTAAPRGSRTILYYACFAVLLAYAVGAPPLQTVAQSTALARARAHAAPAAAAAMPALLDFLDSAVIRAGLQECCSPVAKLPAQELVRRVMDELNAAELVHNFKASSNATSTTGKPNTENLGLLRRYNFLLNGYQATIASGALRCL